MISAQMGLPPRPRQTCESVVRASWFWNIVAISSAPRGAVETTALRELRGSRRRRIFWRFVGFRHRSARWRWFAALDDREVTVLALIADAIGRSMDIVSAKISYEDITDQISIGRNRLAGALRVLSALGLIEVQRGRRGRNTYRAGQGWREISSAAAAQAIAAAARKPRKRSAHVGG
jgi:hypothetical protein